MAGSLRWFGYTSDDGVDLAVQLDESTYESSNLGFPAVAAGALAMRATGGIPLEMRKVNCSRVVDDVTIRQSFYVGTFAALQTILTSLPQITVGGVTWNVQSTCGEKRLVIPPTDTAQLDGDVDPNFAV